MKILNALLKKEFFQIIRDPSSIIIAFVLPLISILIYMYGINLDTDTANMYAQKYMTICRSSRRELSVQK